MPNFTDYDALTEARETFSIKLQGRTIEFPKDMPAKTVLDLRRKALETDQDDESAGIDFLLDMGRRAMGDEAFEYCYERLGLRELLELCTNLLSYYGILAEEGEGEGQGKDAAKLETEPSNSTTSSDGGDSSTQTSNVFGLVPLESSTPENYPGPASSAG